MGRSTVFFFHMAADRLTVITDADQAPRENTIQKTKHGRNVFFLERPARSLKALEQVV
jgi:hypothetical protein